jgi:hypothetical protein
MSDNESKPNGKDNSLANILDNDAPVASQPEDAEMVEDVNVEEEKEVPEGFCIECEGEFISLCLSEYAHHEVFRSTCGSILHVVLGQFLPSLLHGATQERQS